MKRVKTILGVALFLLAGNGVAHGDQAAEPTSAIVLTEIATHGPAGPRDEFVELQNVSSEPQRLGDYRLEFTGADRRIVPLPAFPEDFVLRPHGVYVLAGVDFSGLRKVVNQVIDDRIDVPEEFALQLTDLGGNMIDDCGTLPRPRWPWPPRWPCPCPPAPWQSRVDLSITRHYLTGNHARDYQLDFPTPGAVEWLPQDPVPA